MWQRTWRTIGILGIFLVTTQTALGCQPLIPLALLFGGPAFWSLVTGTLVAFGVIVLVKCGIFLALSDFRSFWAVLFILLANVATSLVGAAAGFLFAAPMLILPGLLFLFVLYLPAARGLKRNGITQVPASTISAGLVSIVFLSTLLFGLSQGVLHQPLIYWPLKVLFCFLGVSLSLTVGVFYEEGIVAGLYKRVRTGEKRFLKPILISNLAGGLLAVSISAAIALPERLLYPNFLLD